MLFLSTCLPKITLLLGMFILFIVNLSVTEFLWYYIFLSWTLLNTDPNS